MASGFFLGGMAEGIAGAQKQALAERAQTEETGLREREIGIRSQLAQHAVSQDIVKRGDELIANTMATVSETIKNGLAVGSDPAKLAATVRPLVDSIKPVAAKIGRDPRAFDAQVQTLISGPTGMTVAVAGGAAKGAGAAAEQTTMATAMGMGGDGAVGFIKDPKDRAELENKERANFQTQSSAFKMVENNFNNIKGLPKNVKDWNGADDITAVFSFLKMLDPNSVASPGEQAAVRGTGGLSDQVAVIYNKLLEEKGAVLGPGMRESMRDRATAIHATRETDHRQAIESVKATAKRRGLNVKNIIDEPGGGASGTTPAGTTWKLL